MGSRRRREKEEGRGGDGRSFIHSGSEGRERAVAEDVKAKQRRDSVGKGKTFRFFVPVGETKQFIVLDDKDDCYVYEHTIPDPKTGKWSLHITCPKENDSCAACEEYGESPYIMFLSILDLTPYTDSKGVKHEVSRKLMAVKPSQQKKFKRLLERKGTMRGAVFETSRDGPKDAAIGNDIEFLEFAKEKELKRYKRKWTDREDKEHVEIMGEPFNYEEVFDAPDANKIRVMLGAEPPMGSKQQQDRDMASDDDGWGDDKDDDKEWDSKRDRKDKKKGKKKDKGSRRKSRGESDDKDEEDSGGKRPRRGRKSKDEPVESERGGRRSRRSR